MPWHQATSTVRPAYGPRWVGLEGVDNDLTAAASGRRGPGASKGSTCRLELSISLQIWRLVLGFSRHLVG